MKARLDEMRDEVMLPLPLVELLALMPVSLLSLWLSSECPLLSPPI